MTERKYQLRRSPPATTSSVERRQEAPARPLVRGGRERRVAEQARRVGADRRHVLVKLRLHREVRRDGIRHPRRLPGVGALGLHLLPAPHPQAVLDDVL